MLRSSVKTFRQILKCACVVDVCQAKMSGESPGVQDDAPVHSKGVQSGLCEVHSSSSTPMFYFMTMTFVHRALSC